MENEIQEKLNTYKYIIGIDEVGRGPIAGPVTVCAFAIERDFINDVRCELSGITDSKKLSEKKRNFFSKKIKSLVLEKKVLIAISSVSAKDIDSYGIVASLRAATKSSLKKIIESAQDSFVYLDGSLFAPKEYDQETIVKGDIKNWLIGAASVVAKVTRDNLMVGYAEKYPEYNFQQHKGYGTKAHFQAIRENGMIDLHRKTWINI